MCEQFRLCMDSEAFVEKAAGFLRATVPTNGTSLTSNYSEELCLQYSYSEEDSEETYGQRELSPGEAQPYGKRMNEPLDQPSTSRKKFRAMTQPGSAVPILYNTSEDNVDTTSSATEQTKDEIRKAYLGTAKINIDNLSVGTALRDVNPQFVENLKKQMLEFTTHAYQPLCVIAKTLSDRGGFKEDTANGFHYDVIGGIHNLLATKALHEIDPGNEEFKCRLCIVYDDSLSKESHLWLANQHNLIGEYRHSLSFREKLMVCRNMFEQAQNSEQSWIDTSAFILSQENKRSVKYFCSIASMNGDIFQRVTSVLAKYEKGKLKGQKVTSENLKEGPQMATYVFRDFVLLPQEAAHKLITDLDSGEINVTYFRDEAKTLRKLQTVQNMFLDLTLCKTWEQAMEQYPEACTRQCLQKYCEGSLKSIPVSLKNFCEKLVKSNAGEVMKVRGSDNTEGTFVISQLPSIDGGLISERCPCFPGFTLALLNKPKKWTTEDVRSFTTDVAALNINKGLTDFSVAVFTPARDTWDMCDVLVATKHFKTVIATFYEISSSTKGPEVSECLYGIAVAIKGSRANQFTWHDGCNSNLIKCEEHERHKSTEAAKCVFRKLILSLSCPHDWVLDGCGSTGNGIVTSLQEGRNCLWIDEDPSKEEEAMIRVANEIQE